MFNAVLHYDLPWNPNRLEQREGRVDRYGQPKRRVKVVRFYGKDNPVDGAVLEVLLNKAKEIYRTLGTFVPVPEESESVMNAIFQSLFRRPRQPAQQLTLFDDDEQIRGFHELSRRRSPPREREPLALRPACHQGPRAKARARSNRCRPRHSSRRRALRPLSPSSSSTFRIGLRTPP